MKKVSILIPCYNEQENVVPMSNAIRDLFEGELKEYDYELLFIDNCSTDHTRPLLREICEKTLKSSAFLTCVILDSLIRRTMDCCRRREIAPL